MTSIRRRLLRWLLVGLVLALAAAGYASYLMAEREVNTLFDYQLRQAALALRHQNLLMLAMTGESVERYEEAEMLVQVLDAWSGLLYVSQQRLPFAADPGFSELYWQGARWRVFLANFGTRSVQVAQPLRLRSQMSADIALRNSAPFFLLAPVVVLVVWFGVGVGLRPLRQLATDLQRRRPGALDPVADTGMPIELRSLVQALNDLLQRLGQLLEAQQQFIADAAHELRTPLTAVRLQTELVQRAATAVERAEALDDLRAGLTRAAHLVEQLLAMARLDADVASPREPVDLLELARRIVADYTPIADARDIDLGLLPSTAVTVAGEATHLRTLLGNLVDNALRYTPAGGKVDVCVSRDGDQVRLEVVDTGPGIPLEERSRVFDRFYRGSGQALPGSGLGLAIVKRIADRHQATIRLDDGENAKGLRVTVVFTTANSLRGCPKTPRPLAGEGQG